MVVGWNEEGESCGRGWEGDRRLRGACNLKADGEKDKWREGELLLESECQHCPGGQWAAGGKDGEGSRRRKGMISKRRP